MNRYILIEEETSPRARIDAAASWLESLGGGTIVSDLKSSLESTFGTRTAVEFKRLEESLSRRGVRLAWRRSGLPFHGNVVAAFTTRDVIETLDEREGIDNLLVLGWAPMDYEDWVERRSPARVFIAKAQ